MDVLNALLPFAPLMTPVVAVVAAIGAFAAVAQKRRADRKAEWWRRAQWAIDKSLSGRAEDVEAGLAALGHLADTTLADLDDLGLMREVSVSVVEYGVQTIADHKNGGSSTDTGTASLRLRSRTAGYRFRRPRNIR